MRVSTRGSLQDRGNTRTENAVSAEALQARSPPCWRAGSRGEPRCTRMQACSRPKEEARHE